jgi:RNA polymerase primary sigma factor
MPRTLCPPQPRKKSTASKTEAEQNDNPQTVGPKRTFQKKSLEDAFLEYCQLSMEPKRLDPARVASLQAEASEHISNEAFKLRSAESEILGTQLLMISEPVAKRSAKIASMPAHLAGLCEKPLLTPDQERAMFQRMNYLRFRASRILEQMEKSPSNVDQWSVERAEGLLRAANWHRDSIVQANLRLVMSIVKKFANHQCSFDDLLSDGIIALMRAVEKFDYDRGFRFSTYATQVVRRNSYRMVMERQEERMKITNSVYEPGMDVADDIHTPTMSEGRWNTLRQHLVSLLDQLDRREKFIIRARFSLGGHRRVQTLQKLADALGVSKERVRQLEKRAMDKLRLLADDQPLEFAEVE